MLKQRARALTAKASNYAMPIMTCAATVGIALTQTMVHADAASLMETVIKIMAKLIIVLGIILAIVGIINWTTANAEGDGPAKHKAVMWIASGIMLVILSVILIAAAPQFTSLIETSI